MTLYRDLVPHITRLLGEYHQVISGQAKAEIWEEICAKALDLAGYGTDWTPDYNHGIGTDQTTDDGTAISNKGGSLSSDGTTLTISGSRLTKFATLDEKIDHIHNKDEDYILCLACAKPFVGTYDFIVIDATKLDYKNAAWSETIGQRGKNKSKVVGWNAEGNHYTASITKSMSDQLWTKIGSELFITHETIITDRYERPKGGLLKLCLLGGGLALGFTIGMLY